jgi:hypothetical protein
VIAGPSVALDSIVGSLSSAGIRRRYKSLVTFQPDSRWPEVQPQPTCWPAGLPGNVSSRRQLAVKCELSPCAAERMAPAEDVVIGDRGRGDCPGHG